MRIATIVLLAILPSTVVGGESHCIPPETVVFSCPVGKKIVSVCAAPGLKPGGALHYRFGPPGAPEMRLPAGEATAPSIQARTLMYSGGGGAYLRFRNGAISYVVYTATGKGWGSKAGVAVEKNGKLSANLKCREAPQSELGPELFQQAGLAQDAEEFELP